MIPCEISREMFLSSFVFIIFVICFHLKIKSMELGVSSFGFDAKATHALCFNQFSLIRRSLVRLNFVNSLAATLVGSQFLGSECIHYMLFVVCFCLDFMHISAHILIWVQNFEQSFILHPFRK